VWYSLECTGEEYDVSTCSSNLNFDSAIRIFTEPCPNIYEEPIMDSVAYKNQSDYHKSAYQSASLVLRTKPGVNYTIVVEPFNELNDGGKGEFDLMVSNVKGRTEVVCAGATVIQPNQNGTIQGSLGNTTQFSVMDTPCAPSSNAPSAWYFLNGTGETYAISSCSRALNFDSVLRVFTGTCKQLECTKFNSSVDGGCSDSTNVASRVVISTELGVEYWIVVLPGVTNSSLGRRFGLTLATVIPSQEDLVAEDGGSGVRWGLDTRLFQSSWLVTVSLGVLLVMHEWETCL
jgi:hypothetical protein